ASRWSRTLWINGPPIAVTAKFDLDYLKSTGIVPNYITSLTPPASQLDQVYKEWLAAPKDLGDAGNLQKAMGAAGARPELGPLPTWIALFLYTGDKRMMEVARGNADLGASFPVHFREHNPAKSFYGRPLSVWDRPTIHLLNIKYASTTDADRVKIVGDADTWGWNPDAAHVPDLYSTLCALTGEEWYCEQLTFWASYVTAYPNGAATTANVGACGRGPTGKEGGFPGIRCMSMRAWAWALRLKALAAVLTPDDRALEKKYYDQVTRDQLVQAEGERNINPRKDALWQWARGNFHANDNNPNHWWDNGNGSFAQDPVDPNLASAGFSTWEDKFVQHNLYRVEELGYPSRALIDWHAVSIKGVVAVDWRLGCTYRTPTLKKDGTPIAFADLPKYYLQSLNLAKLAEDQSRGDHGYCWIFQMAGGADLRKDPDAPANVKWMIVPRQ
ncbi:MAG TPA: hypothetical protein VNT76_09805, partial [Candidatus Binatus sp.]|nr:hypothetical protein [Candidatus Binatus sp.]